MSRPTIRKQKIWRSSVKIRLIVFGTLAVLLILFSIFSEQLTPYDPYLQDLSNAKAPPSQEHLLGTDRYGRDMLSRVIVGSRTSIFSTLLLVAVITVFGTAVGVFCGWSGRWMDTVLMRISDMFLAFPGLVFALAVAGSMGGGLQNAIIALVAEICPHCPQPNACAEGNCLDEGSKAVGQQHRQADLQAHSAEYYWSHSGDGHAGHRHDDDGAGGAELSRTWREGAHRRMGQHDERYAQPDDHLAVDHVFSRHCNFYIRHGL